MMELHAKINKIKNKPEENKEEKCDGFETESEK